jgi:aminopeptidase N
LNNYDVTFYFLDLEVNNTSIDLSGCVTVQAVLVNPETDTLVLELIDEVTVDSVLLDGDNLPFSHSDDFVIFALPPGYQEEDLLEMKVFYNITGIETNRRLGIFNRETSDGKQVTYTLSEPYYAKTWFPCKQVLSDKADSVYVFLTMADTLMAGSNGLLTHVEPLGNDRKRYEWKSYYPVAYYLPSFSVANYMDYSFMASAGDGDSVLIQNYIYNDSIYFLKNKEDIDATADIMEVFSEAMGPYPFRKEKYGHCISPLGGGMEHQTMTTLGNFSFELVAHELAHQWYGDYVTCVDWQNIWINEGFASYGEYIAIERLRSEDEAVNWLVYAHDLAMSSQNSSIFVPKSELENVSRIFDYSLTYRKGASIIHMIRHEVGDELFFNILRQFLNDYSDSVATADDFKNTAEQVSGWDFDVFFQQWFYGTGYPVLDVAWESRNDSLYIYLDQTGSDPSGTPFFNILVDFKIEYFGGDTLVQFRQENASETFVMPFQERVFRITPDPDDWLLREIRGVYRILPDTSVHYHMFPNPAENIVYIEHYKIGLPFSVKIYNLNGILLRETEERGVFAEMDLSDLSAGIYNVVVSDDNGHKEIFQLVKL